MLFLWLSLSEKGYVVNGKVWYNTSVEVIKEFGGIMRKKLIAGLAGMLAVGMLLSGCSVSGKKPSTPAEPNSNVSDVSKNTEENKGKDTATMAEINDYCESDAAKQVVDGFMKTYEGAFSEMRMFSGTDGILTFTYQYKNQQEYEKDLDEVAKEQAKAISAQGEALEDEFSTYDGKGIVLNAFEYVYYNADGTVIADVIYYRGGEVVTK